MKKILSTLKIFCLYATIPLGLLSGCQKAITNQDVNNAVVKYESQFWYKRSLTPDLLNRINSKNSQVVWSTNFHTAAPVPLGAVGPEKYIKQLQGIVQNDSLGRILKKAVNDNMNVILVIGDGMGNMHMALPIYRRYIQKEKEKTYFERIMSEGSCGYLYTNTARGLVTGSAASGTAIACGTKTLMNMVGVDSMGNLLQSAMELAKLKNYSTALVSDASITDATPAVFYAHSYNRDLEANIAYQLSNSNIADVILGGGGAQFIPKETELSDFYKEVNYPNFKSRRNDDDNLFNSFEDKGYELCFTLDEMNVTSNEKVLGLFGEGGLPATIDRSEDTNQIPNVQQMAHKALNLVSKQGKSFFAMIECARIDWEAHDNDVVAVYYAVEEMNRVLGEAYQQYQKSPQNTLVIFTADHETGGLEIAYRKMEEGDRESKQLENGNVWENITNPLLFKNYEHLLNSQHSTISHILSISKSSLDIQKNLKELAGMEISLREAELLYFAMNNYKRYKD